MSNLWGVKFSNSQLALSPSLSNMYCRNKFAAWLVFFCVFFGTTFSFFSDISSAVCMAKCFFYDCGCHCYNLRHACAFKQTTLKHGVVRKNTPLQCARIKENTPLPTDGGYGITHFHGRGVWIHTPRPALIPAAHQLHR